MDSIWARIDRRLGVCLIGLYVLLYILPLGVRPLARPDEVRYGEIAREMIASGDWVSPHLNGVRYFEKPILGHWLNAGSFELFGMNAFALRLPSALAAGLTALLVYWLTLTFANRRAGLLAAGIYLTSFQVFGIGTFAVLDTYLALFLTAAAALYYRSAAATSRQQQLIFQAAFGAACGCAFLAKGFLGLVIPGIVIAPFLVIERRWRAILTDPWIPLLAAVLVALPWSVLIHLREPDFWRYFVVVEHLQRFMGEGEAVQHEQPWWYFLAVLPIVTLPWSPFAWRALRRIRGAAGEPSFIRYLLFWALMPFIFFSISKGKLVTYILPCFAPFAILLGIGLSNQMARGAAAATRWPGAAIAALFGAGFLIVLAAQMSIIDEPVYGAGESLRAIGMLAALAAGCVAGILTMRSPSPFRQIVLAGLAVVPVFLTFSFALPARVLEDKAPAAFIAAQGPFGPDTILIADSSLFGAVSWTLKRDDIYVLGKSELEYGMAYPEARQRELDLAGLRQLVARNRGQRAIVLFVQDDRERELADLLPADGTRAQAGEIVFRRIGVGDDPDG